MNDHPPQPPLGATPEPSALAIAAAKELHSEPWHTMTYDQMIAHGAVIIERSIASELATARAALAQCEERLKEVDDLLTNCGLLSYITAHADNLRRECGENEKWGIETFNAIDKDYADVKRALQILSAARNSRP